MASISNTTAALGGAAAAADVYCWHLNGHPLPVPEDVQLAFGVLIGVGAHAVVIVAAYACRIINAVLEKKLGITLNPPPAGP